MFGRRFANGCGDLGSHGCNRGSLTRAFRFLREEHGRDSLRRAPGVDDSPAGSVCIRTFPDRIIKSMEQLNVKLQIKSLDEAGRFVGLASTYGNVDLGGDVVEPGAFQKTITDRGGEVPLLWSHDTRQPIGLAKLKDTSMGLSIDGQLVLDVPKAREA